MFGVGRDLCGSSSPTPLGKQGHLEQAAQDHVQAGFEYLQRRLPSPSGQPVPGLHYPQSKEVLPHVQMELPLLHVSFPTFCNRHFHFIYLLSTASLSTKYIPE